MLSNHAELMRLRMAGIWWGLELLVAHGSTGQGKHHAELPVAGMHSPSPVPEPAVQCFMASSSSMHAGIVTGQCSSTCASQHSESALTLLFQLH